MAASETAIGIFNFCDEAERAVRALERAGFHSDQISISRLDVEQAHELADEPSDNPAARSARSALAGGAVGGLTGLLVGAGVLAVPGVGPLLVVGPLAGVLAGTLAGAASGGLSSALGGLGLAAEQADWYEAELRRGGTLVTVQAGQRTRQASEIMRRQGARQAGDPELLAALEREPTASEGAPTAPAEADVDTRTVNRPGMGPWSDRKSTPPGD